MPRKKKPAPITAAPHVWRPGHDPNDPDADPDSGWLYLKLSGDTPADTRDKRDKYKKGGGPESGLPCVCGEMTRVVDEVSALEVLEQAFTVDGQDKEFKFNDEQKERFRQERLAILLCPRCERITQFRPEFIALMRARWLEKQAS